MLTFEKKMLRKELEQEKAPRQKAIEDARAANKMCDASFRQLTLMKEVIKPEWIAAIKR